MPRIKKTATLREAFPDRKFTDAELARLSKAVEKAGGRDKYLAKLGFVKLNKHGRIMSVLEFEDINGMEVLKGSGITYFSNIPFQWWNEVGFAQLHSYEVRTAKAEVNRILDLDQVAKTIGKSAKA